MNSGWWRYLYLANRRHWERLSSDNLVVFVISLIILLLVGGIFWSAGRLDPSLGTYVWQLALVLAGLIGLWSGLNLRRSRPSRRPFLNRTTEFWLELSRPFGITLLLTALTGATFSLAVAQTSDFNWPLVTLKILSALLLSAAFFFAGGILSLVTRRLTHRAVFRTGLVLILLAGFLWLVLTSQLASWINFNVLSTSLNRTLAFWLLSGALAGGAVALLSLAFEIVQPSRQPSRVYTTAHLNWRWLGNAFARSWALFFTQLLFYWRNQRLRQRFLLIVLLEFLFLVIWSLNSTLTDQVRQTLGALSLWLIALVIAYPGGELTGQRRRTLEHLPIPSLNYFASGFSATLVITNLTGIFAVGLVTNNFTWGWLAIWLVLNFTLTLINYAAGFLATDRHDLWLGQGTGQLGALVISLIIASLPGLFQNLTSPLGLTLLIMLWLLGFGTVYYRQVNQIF